MGLSTGYQTQKHFQAEPVGLSSFFGGMSVDSKLASSKAPQFYFGRHIDFRKKPSQFTVLPQGKPTAVVSDLVLDMEQINNGDRYAVGDTGNVYIVKAPNTTWANYGNIGENSGAGMTYRADVDHTYITGQIGISRIKRTVAAPIFQAGWFKNGISTCTTCAMTGGTNTYIIPTAIIEDPTDMRDFTVDVEPAYQIGIKVVTPGTGNWTLTLHNDANDVLATVTILNASLKANQINYFIFSTPVRLQRGDLGEGSALTYHYHITSTATDGTLQTTTQGSIIDSDLEYWADALVPTQNTFHPMVNFSNYTLIGNANYLAQYEPLQDNPQMQIDYLPHRLTFPPGFEVCSVAQKNLLCVIGCEKRSPTGEFQEGALFFWDGVGETYDDWWPVNQGSPESLFSDNNTIYFMAGGALYEVLSTDEPQKLRTFRNTDSEFSNITDTTHCYPHTMTVRRGILLMAYPSITTNQQLEMGVYSLGQIDTSYPVSFGLNYSMSTGSLFNNGSNNLRIGMIKNFGDILYVSWRDDSNLGQHYGVDVTDNSSSPATTATIESTIFDGGRLAFPKSISYVLALFEPLPADTTLTLKYKRDYDTNWTYSLPALTGTTYMLFSLPMEQRRVYQFQHGMDLVVGGTSPVIQGLYMFVDMQVLEMPIGGGI